MSCSSRWCKLEEKLFKVTRCCVVGRDVSVAKAANRRHQIGDASVPLGGPLRDRAVVVLDYWKQESGDVNTAVSVDVVTLEDGFLVVYECCSQSTHCTSSQLGW